MPSNVQIRHFLDRVVSGHPDQATLKTFLELMLRDTENNRDAVVKKLAVELPFAIGTHYNFLVRGLLAKPLIAEDSSVCVSYQVIRQKTDDFIAQWKPTLDTLLDQIISEQQRANQLDRTRSKTLSPSQGS